jgi:Holliday junction resolvasome RuvABC endonuclease subunit
MNILGIRVEPKKTTFVVINCDNEQYSILNSECIKVPAALDFPEKLKYIRNCVLDILREYSISVAAIRIAESNAQNLDVTRLHIEGVIQEAFSSSDIDRYFTGRKTSIAARLGIKPKELDEIFKGHKEFNLLDNWTSLTTSIEKEAAMVAIGAFQQ